MLSVYKLRKLLNSSAENLSDEELEQIRNSLYQLSELIFELHNKDNARRK